jgi:hypothetical protein
MIANIIAYKMGIMMGFNINRMNIMAIRDTKPKAVL